MINAIQNIITNPAMATLAQNTTASVSIETGLKAIGRPSFILMDKDLDPQTKKYAATKEFLYQATCLAIYMAVVVPVFKKGFFKFAKNVIFKNEEAFKHFKDANEYLNYRKLIDKSSENKNLLNFKSNNGSNVEQKYDKFLQDEIKKENPEKFPLVKGAIELGSTIGSVLGLAIIAPQVSHAIIHPMLKLCGLEDKKDKKQPETTQKVDVKA